MKHFFIVLLCVVLNTEIQAQFTYKIKADSLRITNDSCSAELILENATRHIDGFLYNKGNGRTEFRSVLTKVNDSVYIVGNDTLVLLSGSSFNSWRLDGNTSTNPNNHFLGTTDSTRIVFRTNNQERATIQGNGNFLIGTSTNGNFKLDVAGNIRASDDSRVNGLKIGKGSGNIIQNTAFGQNALDSNTTGAYNTAVGYAALRNNTTGRINTAIGYATLTGNTTGENNTAIGANSMQVNTTGSNNTAVGYRTLATNSSGSHNTATGFNALALNTTGSQNTAVGRNAMASNTTGTANAALGYLALGFNTTGSGNVAMGDNSLFYNNTGSNNVGIGNTAMQHNTTGYQNVGVGTSALRFNTSGYLNSSFGYHSLRENTTGYHNTAVGSSALVSNLVGYGNTAIGYFSLSSNDSGFHNVAMGNFALRYNKSGQFNAASGVNALQNNTYGSENAATGANSLKSNTTGNGNTGIGYESLLSKTTGDYNTGIGYKSGNTLTGGDSNIFIGYNVQPNIGTSASNQLNIGNWIYGNNGKIGIGISNPTAGIHLPAGSTTANSAPLKMESGSLMSSPENGAIEYDGSNYYITTGGNRYTMARTIMQTASLDFGNTTASNSTDLTITLAGASDGDVVSLGVPSGAVLPNSSFTAWVSAANTVTVRFNNYSSNAQDPSSGTFRVSILKY